MQISSNWLTKTNNTSFFCNILKITEHSRVKGIQVQMNLLRAICFFPTGDKNKKRKIHRWNLKIFSSWTTLPISTKLEKKHPWVKGISHLTEWRAMSFLREDINKIVKLHWWKLKIFSRTTWQISSKLGTKHPWIRKNKPYKGPVSSQ